MESHPSPVRYFDVRDGPCHNPDLLLAAALTFVLAVDGDDSAGGSDSHHYVLCLVPKAARGSTRRKGEFQIKKNG